MLFYIKSIVSIRVRGISGPFEKTVSFLVDNAADVNHAKSKYETQIKKDFAYMQGESYQFQYLEIAPTIK